MREFVGIVLVVWFLIALAVGFSGILGQIPRPALQGILLGLTALALLAYFKLTPLRRWASQLPLRGFIAFHAIRLVGIYFLMLYRRGELPFPFAVPGGFGDIVIATLAIFLCFSKLADRVRVVAVWNGLGLIDILMVVVIAGRLGLQDPASMVALTRLPLSLLPTFFVPLIIATHAIIFFRIKERQSS